MPYVSLLLLLLILLLIFVDSLFRRDESMKRGSCIKYDFGNYFSKNARYENLV